MILDHARPILIPDCVAILVGYRDEKAGRRGRDDGVHNNLIRVSVAYNLERRACIHEQGTDQDQEGASDKEGDVLCLKVTSAILLVSLENPENLPNRQVL